MPDQVTVIKLGGSVLRGEHDLRAATHEVYRWLRASGRVVVVVSAFEGTTDRLLAQAGSYVQQPPEDAQALLLATGEFTTAALLALALKRAGVPASVLPAPALKLRTRGTGDDADPVSLDGRALTRALDRHRVVIVPGFIGVGRAGQFSLLGRGGSDLTALFIASELAASGLRTRCRLIKDVDGLYERDPALGGPRPRRYTAVSYERALELDGGIVQHKAVRLARDRAVGFEVAALGARDATTVAAGPTELESVPGAARRPLRVALLGAGTVGGGVAHLLADCPREFTLVRIAVRDIRGAIRRGLPAHLLTNDAIAAAAVECDIVVELMGGLQPASSAIERALRDGKHVVTANKALIAAEGTRLTALARRHGGTLRHSAAVGGACPMLERVCAAPGVERIEGVINGTCNFVLGRLGAGERLDDCIAAAQHAGLSEADPSRDLQGIDAAEKLTLLARAAFGVDIPSQSWARTPLDNTMAERLCRRAGVAAQVAWAQRTAEGIVGGVDLRILPARHPLSGLAGAENRLVIWRGQESPEVVSGTGAGRWPTAQSVLADLWEVRREVAETGLTAAPSRLGARKSRRGTGRKHRPAEAAAKDNPGALA